MNTSAYTYLDVGSYVHTTIFGLVAVNVGIVSLFV